MNEQRWDGQRWDEQRVEQEVARRVEQELGQRLGQRAGRGPEQGREQAPEQAPGQGAEPVRVHGPDLAVVVGALVLLALAVAVGAHELLGRTWDWKWYAAGVLVAAGLAAAAGSALAGLRQRAASAGRR